MNRYLQTAKRWYEGTPERALDQAYDAVLMIRAIEDEHFNGGKIPASSGAYSDNTLAYFQAELKKYLKIAELRLSEFKASRFIFNSTDTSASVRSNLYTAEQKERSAIVLEKLKFIDSVLDRYKSSSTSSVSLVPISQSGHAQSVVRRDTSGSRADATDALSISEQEITSSEGDGILDKTGVLPRSILGTLNRIKRDLDPKAEEQVVQSFRTTKAKTLISIRFLLLLIIVPLLTQQLSKAVVVGPIVDFFRNPDQTPIFLNFELEEEALEELRVFEERLRFDQLIGQITPSISNESVKAYSEKVTEATPKEKVESEVSGSQASEATELSIEDKLKEKAEEIANQYHRRSSDAIKNIFSDVFALAAFAIVISTNRREIAVLKTFIDETVYGLSDSAKAFIIILFTDMFVGFHSPHGWEVLLEGVSKHLGLPANRDFIFLFIATFPVILDTIFKYWIFRYLNRISPSAVATYRNMNE